MTDASDSAAPASMLPRRAGRLALLTGGIRLPLAVGAVALVVYALGYANAYDLRVLTVGGIYALLVIGYQFIFGHAGALSLAQGAFFGIGAYVTGILGSQLGWTFPATFPLSLILPAIVAVIIAVPVLKLESHYFALATLGIGQVVLLLAINWTDVTGGANGIPGVPPIDIFGWQVSRGLALAAIVWLFVLIGGLVAWQIMRGLYGHAFQVMRENQLAAGSIGINTGMLRFVAFILSALYGGAAGALHVHTLKIVSPEALEFHVMVSCLTMTVIGGRYRVAGAIVGALILVHLPEWFRFLERNYLIAYGAGMLAMIVIAPYGLIGAFDQLRARFFPELPPPAPPAEPLPPSRRDIAPGAAKAPILEVRRMVKRFGGVSASEDVSLHLERGEIVGLIGPNGSGKTTLVNLISGNYRPDSGDILLRGGSIVGQPPHAISRLGVARTFQNLNLVAEMTVLDNVAAARTGAEQAGLSSALKTGWHDLRQQRARRHAMGLLEALGIADVAMQQAGSVPHGIQRRVEIARALATQPEILLLDEPAAGLNETEQADLANRLRGLAGIGLTLMIVEHNMPFLMPLAERMICLDYGRVIASGTPEEIRHHPAVVEAYLGTPSGEA